MKILFLYTELAQYFISCINELIVKAECEVYIVRKSVNKEAPFEFSFPGKIKIYDRNKFDDQKLRSLLNDLSPDLIFCSGWTDKAYLDVCRLYKRKIPVLLGFDNKWKGSFRQRIGILFNPVAIHKYFSHCWVPGFPQLKFAEKLGFKKDKILTGFYSCDYEAFNKYYLKFKELKRAEFPHRFIYVGRYYEFKGLKELWAAFAELKNEEPNNWELWCLGTGDMDPIIHPSIKHFGFVQPKDMERIISETGVFVLPSTFEPWGVAVHEFAAAGFPLICSNEVGAASMFLKNKINGFSFQAGNKAGLKKALSSMIMLKDDQLYAMGEESSTLAKQITPEKWADTLLSVIK
jgi:glycosyltransferase involved in cell wall biosynthesis